MQGYLDDLSRPRPEVAQTEPEPWEDEEVEEDDSREATAMDKSQVDRFGPGTYSDFVEFNEFDGGDGQMGVAGDGNNKLEAFGGTNTPSLFKSKTMSAKNAWGTSSGYADKLVNEGMDIQKAQQLENWQNQQEVRRKQMQTKQMMESFETQKKDADEDWRTLAKFGVERNQDFDMNETFGNVAAGGDLVDTIELSAGINRVALYEFKMKNEYMGFADFRAAFTSDTNQADWTISPEEGSLSKENTDFVVKFKPNNPGVSHATLVVETEDFKKTWIFIGSTA